MHFFRGSFLFYTLKEETIVPVVVIEVAKKASTLTANGDPHLSGRSLFRGLAFLGTVPGKVTLSRQRLLSLRQLKLSDMENYNQIQFVIGKDDLEEIINNIVDTRMQLFFDNKKKEAEADQLIKPRDAAEQLGVNLSTLWRWHNEGYLKKIYIGDKPRYKQRDIDRILHKL